VSNPSSSPPDQEVSSGLPEACLQLLAGVAPYEKWDEGADRRALESSGRLSQALVDSTGTYVLVELLVDAVGEVMQDRVDRGPDGALVSR